MKAYNERKETKANEELNELRKQAQSNNSNVPSKIIGIEPNGNLNNLQFNNVWGSLLKGNYYELKVESLEERLKEKNQTIEELKKEIMMLENQIEILEDEIDEAPGEQDNVIGNLMKNEALINAAAEKLVAILFPKPQSKTA
jgi:hypothetical protein